MAFTYLKCGHFIANVKEGSVDAECNVCKQIKYEAKFIRKDWPEFSRAMLKTLKDKNMKSTKGVKAAAIQSCSLHSLIERISSQYEGIVVTELERRGKS